MKNSQFVLLVLFILSCSKPKDQRLLKESSGVFYGKLNNKDWKSNAVTAYKYNDGTFNFNCGLFDGNVKIQSINIINVYYDKGVNNIYQYQPYTKSYSDSTGAFFSLMGDDAILASYDVLENKSNYMKIESYNSDTKEIKGTFQISFYNPTPDPSVKFDDTLRFTDGVFAVSLK